MPSPSSSLATLRPDLASSLEQFDLAMSAEGFISQRVAPVIEVGSASGTFGQIPLAELLQNRDTLRSATAGYSRSQFKFVPVTYTCEEHGAEEVIDDKEANMYRNYFDLEVLCTKRAQDAVLRNAEARMANAIFNTSVWTGAALTTAAAATWSTLATAVPITDVEGAVQKVYDNSGLVANAIIMGWKAFRNVRRTAQILDNIKYAGIIDPRPGTLTTEALAQVFGLKYLFVGGAPRNSANEGQNAVVAGIWDNTRAMVCRVAETDDPREPCIARTFHWSEDGSMPQGTVERYRDENVRGNIVRVRHDVAEKIMYVQAGHLLTAL